MAEAASAAEERALTGGSYEVIHKRLLARAAELGAKAEALNQKRKSKFGGGELALAATDRVRTENNCVPRDAVSVGGSLLFGFQVFIGLKAETTVADVLSLYRFQKGEAGYDLSPFPADAPEAAFLRDPEFDKQFRDAFRYSKDARLLQLVRSEARLLIVAQIGASLRDIKVFRFAIDAKGKLTFMDGRGEEDYSPPRQHSFAFTPTTRENQVSGRHPHMNILDQVFVETVNGDLTIKVENNTADGFGVYREPVDDPNQTLDDSDIAYARVAGLILLKVKPFREQTTRYFIYNPRNQHVLRVDAIGVACRELPEDHGVLFPGGYYLASGEYRLFEGATADLEFECVVPSPNGEDVLYVFYRPEAGEYALFPYNLIAKEVKNSVRCHGYSLFPDGTLMLFRTSDEATRIHPVQIWNTPFTTSEFAASAPTDGSYLAKVGNKDLVTGISEMLGLARLAAVKQPTRRTFEDIVSGVRRVIDTHYWLSHAETDGLLETLTELTRVAELVVDEFEKVLALERTARHAVEKAEQEQKTLLDRLVPTELTSVEVFLAALSELQKRRGGLIALKELRSVDLARVTALETGLSERFLAVSRACVDFFLADNAFQPLLDRLDALIAGVAHVTRTSELIPLRTELDAVHEGLSLLSTTIAGLPIDDPTVRTSILDGTSSAFSHQNRARASLDGRYKELAASEGRAEFGVQFKLLGQSVTSALALAVTPDACDTELGKLMLALEELEGRFGELDEFSTLLAEKREEVLDAVASKRQLLVEERQRRAQSLATAADRILAGIVRRAQTLSNPEELHGYFASDAMVHKLAELGEKLRELGDSLRADELDSKLLAAKQNALRALKDKADLLEEGGQVIRFGQHRFSVNTRPLELVIVPHEGALAIHLTGTDFLQNITDPALESARELWEQEIASESREVYRGEFLAVSLLLEAESESGALTLAALSEAARDGRLTDLVRELSARRLDEGYERGVHDADAALILGELVARRKLLGPLRYSPRARGAAWLFWQSLSADRRNFLERRARSAGRLLERFSDSRPVAELAGDLTALIDEALVKLELEEERPFARFAARYLVHEISAEKAQFSGSPEARALLRSFDAELNESGALRDFEEDLGALAAHPPERIATALAYVDAFVRRSGAGEAHRLELAARAVCDQDLEFRESDAISGGKVTGLLGAHPRIVSGALEFQFHEMLERVSVFIEDRAPRFRSFRTLRTALAVKERERLRLSEYLPRVLTSFVRNRLIDEVYLPLVGANLAKQLGTVGAGKRTDQMGLLLLVSPPGYGKTTLMEYVASKLGLVFMKVNGPALGTEVRSLDPAEAPNATARQEVEKINLALEMGNNVMLYLDDIQHTHPELLQKFISLCDAQRRIEGVWGGRTRTYDLRGKKFCIVMAGNPYTESGARFQIPDMLANRADTYNLGEILDGKKEAFALSYIENALTSHPLLAPLAGRDQGDIHRLIAMALGEPIQLGELAHGYSSAEAEELVALFKRLFRVQAVLLLVNQQYIASASQDDRFRTEPPFKLQGSYRNMNKLVEKIAPVMNDEEIERLLDDHYAGESQTLTKGAEQNLLKLAELRGRLGERDGARWAEIKESFVRVQRMGGSGDDPVARVTGTLSGLDAQLKGIREAIGTATATRAESKAPAGLQELLEKLTVLGRPRLEVQLESRGESGLPALFIELTELLKLALSQLGDAAGTAVLEQRLSGLEVALSRLSQNFGLGTVAARRVDVDLEPNSPSNFYQALSAPDLFAAGGLFVATYQKPPPLGAEVQVTLGFPTGQGCEFSGHVSWHRDDLGADAPPGFGVRFVGLSDDARSLITTYARARAPILRDDG